ncbi:MAG: hypothetical protein JWP03_3219 [Phycisphaerales bacterium]|nr:hypothetical protein [Phycisphaerales bacterium]
MATVYRMTCVDSVKAFRAGVGPSTSRTSPRVRGNPVVRFSVMGITPKKYYQNDILFLTLLPNMSVGVAARA